MAWTAAARRDRMRTSGAFARPRRDHGRWGWVVSARSAEAPVPALAELDEMSPGHGFCVEIEPVDLVAWRA
ncbi:MAG TPA: hypothetical protein VGK33_20645, partial [Chloroflexota bacterium]